MSRLEEIRARAVTAFVSRDYVQLGIAFQGLEEQFFALLAIAEAAEARIAAEDEGRVAHPIYREWDCPCCKAHDAERAALAGLRGDNPK